MDNVQENKLSMYLSVQKVTNTHSAEWQGLPAYATIFASFEDAISQIRNTRLVQEGQITGITKDKAQAQNNAIEKAIQVATAVFAYASIQNNNTLKDKVSYSPSELRRSRDTILIDRLEVIHEAATSVLAELANYGLTQADLDEFSALITSYTNMVEDPRVAITNRARATKDLKSIFKTADKILKEQLDKLMLQYKKTAPEFYQQYFNARLIIDLGIRHKKDEDEEGDEGENTNE